MLQNQVLIQVSHRIQMFIFLPGREGKNRNSLAASGQSSAHLLQIQGRHIGIRYNANFVFLNRKAGYCLL